jgi:uncharacterized C2H2 Zn-finger protein
VVVAFFFRHYYRSLAKSPGKDLFRIQREVNKETNKIEDDHDWLTYRGMTTAREMRRRQTVNIYSVNTEIQPAECQSGMCYFKTQTTLTHSVVLESRIYRITHAWHVVASRNQCIPTLPLSQDHHNPNDITYKKYKQKDTTKHLAVHAASQTVSSSSAWSRCPRLDQLWRSTPRSSLDFNELLNFSMFDIYMP